MMHLQEGTFRAPTHHTVGYSATPVPAVSIIHMPYLAVLVAHDVIVHCFSLAGRRCGGIGLEWRSGEMSG
jgi:hypothetical protein